MKIAPFDIEQYFARYEFNTPYLLCSSDCETISVTELLEMSGQSAAELGGLRLGYTESQGNPALRAAIASMYDGVSAEEIVVLGSPEEGIYLGMRALLEPGDHVVVLSPAYDSLLNLARHISENVDRWELKAGDSGWEIDLDELADLVSPRTKLIVVNFPHNPTGFLPSPDQLFAIVEIAQRNGAWIFCDEMYRGLELNGLKPLLSMADAADHSLALAGLSKVHGLPGLRSGWLVVADESLRAEILNWKFYTSICPPAPSEFLALAALQAQEQLIKRSRGLIERNVGMAEEFFGRWSDMFTWRPPQAGSVALVGLHQPSAEAYCHHLAQTAGVLLLPSTCLGYGDEHVRMGFGRENFGYALAQYETFLRGELTGR
jgi:aspartate/methionine/tyrosine aminotransferase